MSAGTDFQGRTVIVTGSSRGIGNVTAKLLAGRGARVVMNGRKTDELDSAVADLRSEGGDAIGVAGNVAHEETPHRLVEAALDAYGRVDHVVNTAGINASYGPLMQTTREAFVHTMTVNTWPAVALVQAAVQAGLGTEDGSVVNISTIGARQVQPLLGAYTASKAGLDVLTRVMARELGPYGIRVNGVAPGLVRTDMARVLWEDGRGEAEAEILPLQRIGEPEDIGRAVAFLLSDEARWITGVTIAVDGGRLLVGDEPRELFGVYAPRNPAS